MQAARQTALIGTGFMGWVHLEALRRLGIPVATILGSSHAKTLAATQRYGLPKAPRNYAEVLNDPEIGVVHIGTPNHLHFSMVRDALAAGKHVLCEKPLAMHSAESQELVRLASLHRHLVTAVNYNMRFYPLCIEARARLARGDVGELLHVQGGYVQDWLLYPTDFNWRVMADEGGALRAVADIGTHWLDLLQSITDRQVQGVCADLATVHPQRFKPQGDLTTFRVASDATVGDGERACEEEGTRVGVTTEDIGNVLLEFAGGVRGVLHVSQVTAGRKNRLNWEIAGSRQAMAWHSESPNELWIGHRDRSNELLLRDPQLLSPAARDTTSYPGGHNEGYADTFKQLFRAFYDYIEAGDTTTPPSFPTFADGHREITICDAILSSHRTRQWVSIPGEKP